MLNILLVVMVIAAVALAFYAFRNTGGCVLPCFVCGMVAVVAWTFLVDMPFNFETKTNSYALAQLENQQFYSIGTGSKSISVLINDDGILKKKSFNEDIVAITTTETEAPKIEITAEYHKEDTWFYGSADDPVEYKQAIIYIPQEN